MAADAERACRCAPGMRPSAAGGRRRSDRVPPSARRAGRPTRCTGPRSRWALPGCGGPSAENTISSSMRQAPRGPRGRSARPWRSRARWSGRPTAGARSGVPLAREPIDALGVRALAAHGPQHVPEVLLRRAGSRSGRQATMSLRRVSGPRFGATPVSTQALRFWYMTPRVPSIGSTMIATARPPRACRAAARRARPRSLRR